MKKIFLFISVLMLAVTAKATATAIPGTLSINDAVITGGTITDDVIKFDDPTTGIASWDVTLASTSFIEFAITIKNKWGHNFTIAVYKEDGTTFVGQVTEGVSTYTSNEAGHTLTLGGLYLNAGNYVLKVTNSTEGSDAKIAGLTLTYAGGAAQNLPGTPNLSEAWFSPNGTRANSKITFPGSTIQEGWVKWNVSFANSVKCNVTVNINTSTGHNYTVALYKNEEDASPITWANGAQYSQTGTPVALNLGAKEIPAGNYILKVTNDMKDSNAELLSVVFTYLGGNTVNVPNASIPFADAILSNRAFVNETGLHFTDADHVSTVSGEWAKWHINATAGAYYFTVNANGSDWGVYQIKISDNNSNEVFFYSQGISKNGSYTTSTPVYLDGNYTLELRNTNNYSGGYLTGLSAAVATASDNVLIIDEDAESMQYIIDLNGESRKIIFKRSFTANMYNTILFPFNELSTSDLNGVFGEGYELVEMTSAELEGDILNLNFSPVDISKNTYGTPYLIKPTKNAINPVFSSRTVYASTSHLTVTGANADFIGTYVAINLAPDVNTLFLAANNMLYYPTVTIPLKGTRAYFQVHGAGGSSQAPAIRGARIVTRTDQTTGFETVKESENAVKVLQNGQLFIIRDGVKYDMMGRIVE